MENDAQEPRNDSRRAFIRNSGSALLAGYAFTKRTGLAQTVQRPDSDRYQSITLNTHDYTISGEIQERIDFPKDWQIDVLHQVGRDAHPPMTPVQIAERIRNPIGSPPLREIAAGKKNAVVTFDDMSRPTPVHLVAEHVANELNAAGIDDDHILFLNAPGSHRMLSHVEAMMKLGPVIHRCPWDNHSVHQHLVKIGRTSWHNMIEINGYFMKADVKVLIGGIKDHPGMGYSAGAKGIIPGIVSLDTIYYNHAIVGGVSKNRRYDLERHEGNDRPKNGRNYCIDNEKRLDAIDAARLAGVDFSVNIVQTGDHNVMNVFCGDVVEAHLEAARFAHENTHWDKPDPSGEYDIVIRNSFPASHYSPFGFGRPREGGTSVAIMQSENGGEGVGGYHIHQLHTMGWFDLESWWDYNYNPRESNQHRIVCSQYTTKANLINMPDVEVYPSWDQILPILEKKHGIGTRVLVYPYIIVAHRDKECTLYPEDIKEG